MVWALVNFFDHKIVPIRTILRASRNSIAHFSNVKCIECFKVKYTSNTAIIVTATIGTRSHYGVDIYVHVGILVGSLCMKTLYQQGSNDLFTGEAFSEKYFGGSSIPCHDDKYATIIHHIEVEKFLVKKNWWYIPTQIVFDSITSHCWLSSTIIVPWFSAYVIFNLIVGWASAAGVLNFRKR